MATRKGAKRDEYALEGGAAAKQAKTQESTESAVIGNVDAFCASLKEGPELLLLIRKVWLGRACVGHGPSFAH